MSGHAEKLSIQTLMIDFVSRSEAATIFARTVGVEFR
jgi:hypothetical protein